MVRTLNEMRNFENYKDLILVLTQKEIKIRYKNSVLGYFWSILHPLAFAFVFFIAFKIVMRIQIENYTLFLLSGLFPWQWLANSVGTAPGIFIGNASIIKKVNFPRNIIPLVVVLQNMLHFILSIPVIVLFIFIYNKTPYAFWLYAIPLLLFLQFVITYFLSLLISSINIFFRDMEKLTVIAMMLFFYMTPIIYSVQMVPERFRHLIIIHPFAPLMINWRNIFLYGTINTGYLISSIIYAIFFSVIGYAVYKKLSWKFAEVL
jgi:lipopolysaccharide transport system permease protein